eukprot:scaffold476_cov77-Skeletonema_marinoi.AAC.2
MESIIMHTIGGVESDASSADSIPLRYVGISMSPPNFNRIGTAAGSGVSGVGCQGLTRLVGGGGRILKRQTRQDARQDSSRRNLTYFLSRL